MFFSVRQGEIFQGLGASGGPLFPAAGKVGKSTHRRVSRFPATLWRENRDTSPKPPRFIRHRRRFGGFRQKPMVFGFPFPSRVAFVMGRSGNRLSNRPAAAPAQMKGRVDLSLVNGFPRPVCGLVSE